MPGVPSYRGCDACRKQKKKCDQGKPACARCARLKLPCIGVGQQRFKFKDETELVAIPKGQARDLVRSRSRLWSASQSSASSPSLPPSNSVTVTTSSLISLLNIGDPRYDVSTLGGFIIFIPQRLGVNSALDASVRAFASVVPLASKSAPEPSRDAISKCANSLTELRKCLQDRRTMRTPETLCAIYLATISQGFVGGLNTFGGLKHSEAIAHILSTSDFESWRGEFEQDLLVSLSTLVIFESMFNPNIQLHPWLDRVAASYGSLYPIDCRDGDPIGDLDLLTFAKLAGHFTHPEKNMRDVQLIYEQMREFCPKLRKAIEAMDEPPPPGARHGADALSALQLARIATRCQICMAMTLTVVFIFNRFICVAGGDTKILAEDRAGFVDDLAVLSRIAASRYPLGAGCMPICLLIAWCTVTDVQQRITVQLCFGYYLMDSAKSPTREMLQSLRAGFNAAVNNIVKAKSQRLLEPLRADGAATANSEVSPSTLPGACTVM